MFSSQMPVEQLCMIDYPRAQHTPLRKQCVLALCLQPLAKKTDTLLDGGFLVSKLRKISGPIVTSQRSNFQNTVSVAGLFKIQTLYIFWALFHCLFFFNYYYYLQGTWNCLLEIHGLILSSEEMRQRVGNKTEGLVITTIQCQFSGKRPCIYVLSTLPLPSISVATLKGKRKDSLSSVYKKATIVIV